MWMIIILIIICIAIFVSNRVMKVRQIQRENEMLQSYMLTVQELYKGIYDRVEATRRYRHDLAKHIQTQERLLKRRGEVTEINEYIEEQVDKYRALKHLNYCNDEVLDAILTLKNEECEKKHIPFQVEVDDRFYEGLEEIDKTGLILNILDNAIEASERIPENQEKGIWFEMHHNENNITIQVENHIRQGKKVTFKTQKPVKEEHGIGTKIIESVVEKYHGTRELVQDEQRWVLQDKIVLRLAGE